MVRAGGHIHGDGSGAIGNGGDGDGGSADTHLGNAVVIGGGSHDTIPRAGNGNRAALCGVVQGQAGSIQGQAPGGLPDTPGDILPPGTPGRSTGNWRWG